MEKGQSYLQKSTLISSEEDAGNEVEEILTLEITKPAAKLWYSHVTWYQNHTDPLLQLSLVSKFNARLISQADNLTGLLYKEKYFYVFDNTNQDTYKQVFLYLELPEMNFRLFFLNFIMHHFSGNSYILLYSSLQS